MKIVNRKTKEINDYQPGIVTKWAYNTILGRMIIKLFNNHFSSKIVGFYMNSWLSKPYLKKVLKKYKMVNNHQYRCYNDFFTRKKDINFVKDNNIFISPCESKLLVLKIDKNNKFNIKNSVYTTNEIINDNLINDYLGGYLLIFRLDVNNYHRYIFIDDGTKEEDHFIKGKLHTVQPIAYKKYKVFHENSRIWSILHTKHFDDVIYCEVGAMNVGKIVNEDITEFHKGDEKGHFEFGGSTILLFVKKNQIIIDSDILDNSNNLWETTVDIGERIGIKK